MAAVDSIDNERCFWSLLGAALMSTPGRGGAWRMSIARQPRVRARAAHARLAGRCRPDGRRRLGSRRGPGAVAGGVVSTLRPRRYALPRWPTPWRHASRCAAGSGSCACSSSSSARVPRRRCVDVGVTDAPFGERLDRQLLRGALPVAGADHRGRPHRARPVRRRLPDGARVRADGRELPFRRRRVRARLLERRDRARRRRPRGPAAASSPSSAGSRGACS